MGTSRYFAVPEIIEPGRANGTKYQTEWGERQFIIEFIIGITYKNAFAFLNLRLLRSIESSTGLLLENKIFRLLLMTCQGGGRTL